MKVMRKKKKTRKTAVAKVKQFANSNDEVFQRWDRPPSPTPSSHSSEQEDFDQSKYALERNKRVSQYQASIQSALPEQKHHVMNSLKNAQLVYYEDDISDSSLSEPSHVNPEKVQHTVHQITEDTMEKGALACLDGGINFCYLRFQRALQIKWDIIRLQRYEDILGGRSQITPAIPDEWVDYDRQFESLYGPMDKTTENYKTLLRGFKVQRLKLYIDIMEIETTLISKMLASGKSMSEWTSIELYTKEKRLEIEDKLEAISEANLDMNPYTSGTGMDFFVLPRPTHPTLVYEVQPKEFDNLVEFTQNQDNLHVVEGYNAAICDVGCTHPGKVIGDKNRKHYFKGLKIPRKRKEKRSNIIWIAKSQWYRTLLKLKNQVLQYPVGVEAMRLVQEYRDNEALLPSESVFGRYSDAKGVLKVSDVFFPQRLGKDKRVILFPSVFEGIILTPDEIFIRIWNKIKFMLYQNKSIKVGDLVEMYEKFFGQQLFALNWGFSGTEHFVKYSFKNFAQELVSIKCVNEDEVEAETVKGQDDDGWENVNDGVETEDAPVYMSQNLWNCLDTGLPENSVCKLPFDHEFFDVLM